MRQTEGKVGFAELIRMRLGFDPKEAVAAGCRRGWCEQPAAAPRPALPDVGPHRVAGDVDAAHYAGVTVYRLKLCVEEGRLRCEQIGGVPVYELAALEELRQAWARRLKARARQKETVLPKSGDGVVTVRAAIERLRGREFGRDDLVAECPGMARRTVECYLRCLMIEGAVVQVRGNMGPQPAVYRTASRTVRTARADRVCAEVAA